MPRLPPEPLLVQLLAIATGGHVTVAPDGETLLVVAPVRIDGVVHPAVAVPIDRKAFDDSERMRLLAVRRDGGVEVTGSGRLMLRLWGGGRRKGSERKNRRAG